MTLAPYNKKRDFDRTSEPAGAVAESDAGWRFVIQRHRARRLHYDFRLEAGGVLVSWAVPKGVTLDPKARHLAVHVEDHPVDYIDFEGVIPAGEYGGGDVIVWDRGTWELQKGDDPIAAVESGEVHAALHGEKIRGRIVLIRTRTERGKEQWIVLHKKDEFSVEGWDPEAHPRSVVSGRTNDEVAAEPERLWTPDGSVTTATADFAGATSDEIAALDALGTKGRWTLAGRELALTNLDKVLFPPRGSDAPITKRDLVRYAATIAPVMLPYLAGRPLNLNRFPNGVGTKGFWQKAAPDYAPEWIPRWHNDDADDGESDAYLVADSAPALAWLANHGALELHPWTSTVVDSHRPTYALVDLDPGTDTTWDELLVLARLHRTALEHLSVQGFPKVTGQRGIQVWIPIDPGPTFDETRTWVEQLSRAIGATVPDLVSWSWQKDARHGRARLDYTQNAINKTLVAPYSTRPAAGAPVSVPITWDELDDPALAPDRWTIRDVGERIATVGDPMAGMRTVRQHLPELA